MDANKAAGLPARVQNGLAEAIGFCGGPNGGVGIGGGTNLNGGFPFNSGSPFTSPVSNPASLFVNLRWFLVSNWRQVLSQAYVELGLIQSICRVPVDDALRGGIEVKSKQLGEQNVEELLISVDRDDDLSVVSDSATWNRLYGGAGTLVLTDQDPASPLRVQDIRADEALEFRAVDMWELFWDKQNTEGYDPAIQSQNFEYYNYYGQQVHKSRVMRLTGMTAPSFIRPRLRGWGFSVVEALIRSLNQYLKATDLTYQVLDEFKLDIYSIEGFNDILLMGDQGAKQVQLRIAMANWLKNFQNALVMDSKDKHEYKQLSFAGLAEAQQGIRMQVAADMRMPMLKLFGTPASGLNASDEESLEVYNSMVESEVRNKIKYHVLRILELKCQRLFSYVPDDLQIAFKPLRVLSAEQEEAVRTHKFNRLIQSKQLGLVTDEEFAAACNKGNLLDIRLERAPVNPTDGGLGDETVEGANDPEEAEENDPNPGADRIDTRKTRATETGGAGKEPPAPKSKDSPSVKPMDAPDESGNPRAKKVKNAIRRVLSPESRRRRAHDGTPLEAMA